MKTTFIFTIHFHQPIGQAEWIMERVHKNSYELLYRILNKHKDLPLTLHFSGPLLETWKTYYPEYLERLRKLVEESSFEVMGGSLAESILALLPWEDRVKQLVEGRRQVEETLGVKPRGLWLPERVWDPTLPPVIARAGYEYVLVDDTVGYRAGLWAGDVHRAWNTEYDGSTSKILFIDAQIRYLLPWRSYDEVLGYLYQHRSPRGENYVLWGSDAEKFGEWWDPGSAEAWLNGFLNHIRRVEWLELKTPTRYLLEHGVVGLVYLPPGSYDKMMEWSGGYFPSFLRKYVESNNMHKKMLWVRRKLVENHASGKAWREYFWSQCNDAFWHGLFGGIYIPLLRQAVYEHLIRAERILEEEAGVMSDGEILVWQQDFDYDGWPEILLESKTMNAYIKPRDGGTLFELDYKEPGREHNLLNTMTRVMEPYLEGTGFKPDWYRRTSFREHIWRPETSLWDWVNNTPFVDVSDFALAHYSYTIMDDGSIRLSYLGRDWSIRDNPKRILVVKTYRLKPVEKTLEATISWRNMEEDEISPKLSVELTIAPRQPTQSPVGPRYIVDDEYVKSVEEAHESPWSKRVVIETLGYPKIIVEQDKYSQLWVAPINSYSRTEKGLKTMFQALGIVFNHQVTLKPGQVFETTIRIGVRNH